MCWEVSSLETTTMRDDGHVAGIATLVVRFPSAHTEAFAFFAHFTPPSCRARVRPPVFSILFFVLLLSSSSWFSAFSVREARGRR